MNCPLAKREAKRVAKGFEFRARQLLKVGFKAIV